MTPASPTKNDGDGPSQLVVVGTVSALGFELVGFVFVGLFLGSRIDNHFEVQPFGVVAGVTLALVAFGWHAYHISRRYLVEEGEK